MSRLCSSRVHQDTNKLEDIWWVVIRRATQVVDCVGPHIDFAWEREVFVDLVTLQCAQIEVEPFEMKYEIVWNVLQASSGRPEELVETRRMNQ